LGGQGWHWVLAVLVQTAVRYWFVAQVEQGVAVTPLQ